MRLGFVFGSPAEFSQLGVGADHQCLLGPRGSPFCWGNNQLGQVATPLGPFEEVSPVEMGRGVRFCGLRENGDLECWGRSWLEPFSGVREPEVRGVVSFDAGVGHACGVMEDGSLDCWGRSNDLGQLAAPRGEFLSVSVGNQHSCAVAGDGSVECWGSDEDGQLSAPSGAFSQVSAGAKHSCGVRTGGAVECWGRDGKAESSPPGGEFLSVVAGETLSCGIRAGGEVECWGTSVSGVPEGAGPFSMLAGDGGVVVCGLRSEDGFLVCWGGLRAGTPPGEFTWVSGGKQDFCGLRPDGEVVCW